MEPKIPAEQDQELEKVVSLNWLSIFSSGLAVVGVAWAAAYTSTHSADRGVGITAWVAVAVIGASAMIATARNMGGRK